MLLDLSLEYKPDVVVSIVGPSRSGSTVFKHALCLHPELTSLAGEEEPYYKLAKNGYPWHKSDAFEKLKNPELVRACIANELLGSHVMNLSNRLWLQRKNIEEPPFVTVPDSRRVTSILVLKTPQNVYRRGIIEQLYPRVPVKHIVMNRPGPEVVNGLIDGWLSPYFTARKLSKPMMLDGQEYPWWKFDMPPGWGLCNSVVDAAVMQYSQAMRFASDYYPWAYQAYYQDILVNWRHAVGEVWKWLGLTPYAVPSDTELPTLMATDLGGPGRWKEKRPWLADLI